MTLTCNAVCSLPSSHRDSQNVQEDRLKALQLHIRTLLSEHVEMKAAQGCGVYGGLTETSFPRVLG